MKRTLLCIGWLCWMWFGVALGAPPATNPTTNPAAWCDAVTHAPAQPKSGQVVRISVGARAGVKTMTLEYQVVEPGAYVELAEAAYKTGWVAVPMKLEKATKEGASFTSELPGELQKHRRLVRYRLAGVDAAGKALAAPDPAGTSPNYAYFVYDGIPAWTAAVHPRSPDPRKSNLITFTPEVLARTQAYHLIGKKISIENATWNEQARGKEYKYTGTLVVDGVVHDHVRYRARGGVWRYATGKNMWKLDLPDEHKLAATDDYGQAYPVGWGKVNLRGVIQLGNHGHRGEQGMYESVGFRLFSLVNVEASRSNWVQLRIIDEAEETPKNQYQGDFWGLYLAIENVDGRFLKAHGLPDGNVYKMANGTGELSHQGAEEPADGSDLQAFLRVYNGQQLTEEWWRDHLNLSSYFSYRAICDCIHHYDIGDGKNYFYYFNPATKQWQVIPWDIDLTWADDMYGSGAEPFQSLVLGRPAFRLEYQNRLREIRDLLFNMDQTGKLIDECAALISDPAGGPAIVEADRRKWDNHPRMAVGSQAGQGMFYASAPRQDFKGMVQLMKDYVRIRGNWVDVTLLNDRLIPETPAASYVGAVGFPPGQLRFKTSAYMGRSEFAGMQWRLGEVAPADAAPKRPGVYEITPVWQSGELEKLVTEATIPDGVAKAGHTYRLRVRMKDATGRWSHWSAPVEFVAGSK